MKFGHGFPIGVVRHVVQLNLKPEKKHLASSKSSLTRLLTVLAIIGLLALVDPRPTAAASSISATPSAASFGSVPVGVSNSQTIKVTNNTTGKVTLGLTVSGSGFTLSNVPTDRLMAAHTYLIFNVVFSPGKTGSYSGSLKWSNGSASAGSMNLTGTGTASTVSLSASSSTLAFGNDPLNTKVTLPVTLTNKGNVNVTISTVAVSGSEFGVSGIANGTVLKPSQSATVEAAFDPAKAGAATGKITVTSSAASSPSVSLSGTGTSATQASVSLHWTATANALGYYVFRGSKSGGPYTQLNSSMASTASYVDSTVERGETYFYVVASVNSSHVQSSYSNQAEATVPSSP